MKRELLPYIIAIAAVILGVGVYVASMNKSSKPTVPSAQNSITPSPTVSEDEAVFCTQDVMRCPDGSYVGRVAPNCEFAACPAEEKNPDY